MQNNQFVFIKSWVEARNLRERVLLVVVGCAVIYMLWNFLFARPVAIQERALQGQIVSLTAQINTLKVKSDAIFNAATANSTNQKMSQQKSLISQADTIKKQIDALTKSLVTKAQLPQVLNDVTHVGKGVNLVDLKYVNAEPLIPSNVDASGLPIYNKLLFRNNYVLTFQSNYFDAIGFLSYLETLQWHLYLDSLEYKVATYPKAEVTLRFHVLMDKADNA